jgi:phosphoribosyl 1,2-cyclic phosphodiesterase
MVKRLVLYHHDPDRSDDALDRIAVEAQKQANQKVSGLEVVVAREGMELAI